MDRNWKVSSCDIVYLRRRPAHRRLKDENTMQQLKIELDNCYGIRKLDHDFDFSNGSVYAIYAANGAMKSCLAQTFQDLADGKPSRDRIFPTRATARKIVNEKGVELPKESVLLIRPYDEVFGHTEKTSTLLVDAKL